MVWRSNPTSSGSAIDVIGIDLVIASSEEDDKLSDIVGGQCCRVLTTEKHQCGRP